MIDRKKVERALEIADMFDFCNIAIQRRPSFSSDNGEVDTIVSILVFGSLCRDPVDRALELLPKLRKHKVSGDIWAKGTVDGIEIDITDVDKCKAVQTTIQVPEMAATGKMIDKPVTEYVCPEDVE